jgi:hypothetical protein
MQDLEAKPECCRRSCNPVGTVDLTRRLTGWVARSYQPAQLHWLLRMRRQKRLCVCVCARAAGMTVTRCSNSGRRKLILSRDHCWSCLCVQALNMSPGCSNALMQPGNVKERIRQRIWDASQ